MDEIIPDQVVEKSNNRKIQEKLLTIDDLTLEKAIEVASSNEATTKFMKQMSIKSEVHNVQGKNVFTDCLSRLLMASDAEEDEDDFSVVACTMLDEKECVLEEEWRNAVPKDKVFQTLCGWLEGGWPKTSVDDEVKVYKEIFHESSLVDGILRRANVLVVPQVMGER
ncbi:hypothetical protein NDU88_009001 [Pleurodeles waltl]|uniref:Uncharacterized protein n=1 Tax=Pleurodeles waltl TaxID=8319 RepID=A0AAV7NXY7_PLEWA|nr:hypothetical protein NDU88_009001 [Pleurodeles waltl]